MLSITSRPQKLSEMAGQPLVKKVLKAVIEHPEQAPKTLIFGGSFGSGKTSSARILARALNCTGKGEKPCGKCSNCQMDLEASPFYTELDASVVGNVDKIRELKETFYSTMKDGYRIIVFDECVGSETRIYCKDGNEPKSLSISEIVDKKLSVEVYSYNQETGQFEFKPIRHYFNNGIKQVRDRTFNTSSRTFTLTCTDGHKFITKEGAVLAKDLKPDTEVLYFNTNGYLTVAKQSYYSEPYEAVTYDLEVADNHTYLAQGLIVHNCHLLSRMAMGSLLKVLEDTPKGVIFLLCTTDVDKLLPTIRSRSLELKFDTISEEDMLPNLKSVAEKNNIEVDDRVLKLIYRMSGGHPRSAHQFLDYYSLVGREGFLESARDSKTVWEQYFLAVAQGNKEQVLKAVDDLMKFPLDSLLRDYEELLAELARCLVEENESTELFKAFGANILKFIKFGVSSFIIESFANDSTLQAALLCMFQMVGAQQSAPQAVRQVNRSARR